MGTLATGRVEADVSVVNVIHLLLSGDGKDALGERFLENEVISVVNIVDFNPAEHRVLGRDPSRKTIKVLVS